MVRHIVMWDYKDGFTGDKNKENAERVKHELESLANLNGIIEFNVFINEMISSSKDVILNSLFENEEALAAYQIHPEHQRVSEFVGTVFQNRACFDYHC